MKQIERTQEITIIKDWLGAGSINMFGLPFAGKDTHGEELALRLDGAFLSGGDILRNSIIPEDVRKTMDAGMLIPTEDYIKIVLPYLSRDVFSGKPLVLSSVGRWFGEQEGVLQAAKASNHELKAVIYLHVDQSVALERWRIAQEHLTRGERADDAEHLLEVRFEEFNEKTLPVINYYRDQGLLIEIDGAPSVSRVSQNIIEALVEFSQRSSA